MKESSQKKPWSSFSEEEIKLGTTLDELCNKSKPLESASQCKVYKFENFDGRDVAVKEIAHGGTSPEIDYMQIGEQCIANR